MPKISVIMPAYNGERYIGAAIDSVLAQSTEDFELITVDDGSTDDTLAIMQAYARSDARIRVISRKNSGRPSIPKNDGIVAATGDYVCFLDHDDLYAPDRLQQLASALDRHQDWVATFHDMQVIDEAGTPFPGTYLSNIDFLSKADEHLAALSDDWFECGTSFFVFQSLVTGALHTDSVMIARDRLPEQTLLFDIGLTIGEDTDLWVRLGLAGKIGYLNRPLCSYRRHATNLTLNREKYVEDIARYHKFNYERVRSKLTSSQDRQLRERVSHSLADLAYLRYRQYRLKDARATYREAMSWALRKDMLSGYVKTFLPKRLLEKLLRA